MTLVSPSQSSAGEEINASDINDPINQITTVVNGNLDDSNIASLSGSKIANASIATAKLEDASVTIPKLATGVAALGNFSTSEVSTGFTWIDGKTIYKKTISVGALPNATTKNTAHGISNLSSVINISGFAVNSTTFFPLPHATSASGNLIYGIGVYVSGSNIVMDAGDNRSSFSGYVTLLYTKTV